MNPLDLEAPLYVAELSECFMGSRGGRLELQLLQRRSALAFLFRDRNAAEHASIACGAVYIYWMRSQGFTSQQITQVAGATFADNYQTLTGKTTAYADLRAAVTGIAITSDNPF